MSKQNIKLNTQDKNNLNIVQKSVQSENVMDFENIKENNNNEEYNINKQFGKLNKCKKRGIIYLSTIPKYMNVTKIREIFSAYGKIGRVYLQLANNELNKKKRKECAKHFTEGWIEFESKKVAKNVAVTLNNNQISCKKKSKFYDVMWNIKYLPRFKWIHLSERLAYERAVHKQRLRTEIAQTKREVNFFSYNIERSKKLNMKSEHQKDSYNIVLPKYSQKKTDIEIQVKKNKIKKHDRTEFLKSLFEF